MLMGKVPVNLNYTAANETLESCAKQCNLKTVITARAFLERVRVQPPGETIFLEDLAQKPRFTERLGAALALFLPPQLVEKYAGAERKTQLEDIATIIFSSGSTGEPKGVDPTHSNVPSNVEQLNQGFLLPPNDPLLGILPFLQSFAFPPPLSLPPPPSIST